MNSVNIRFVEIKEIELKFAIRLIYRIVPVMTPNSIILCVHTYGFLIPDVLYAVKIICICLVGLLNTKKNPRPTKLSRFQDLKLT